MHSFINKIKQILTIIFIISIFTNLESQNNSGTSGLDNKNAKWKHKGDFVSSQDFYPLLINKDFNVSDPSIPAKYSLVLTAASRVLLSDSLIKSTGLFELKLSDGNTIILIGAHCGNAPCGFKGMIGFSTDIDYEQLKIISKTPIVSLTVFGILTTRFSPSKQKEQQKIANRLLEN